MAKKRETCVLMMAYKFHVIIFPSVNGEKFLISFVRPAKNTSGIKIIVYRNGIIRNLIFCEGLQSRGSLSFKKCF